MITTEPLDILQSAMNDAFISRLTAEDPNLAHMILLSARVAEEVLAMHGWRTI